MYINNYGRRFYRGKEDNSEINMIIKKFRINNYTKEISLSENIPTVYIDKLDIILKNYIPYSGTKKKPQNFR